MIYANDTNNNKKKKDNNSDKLSSSLDNNDNNKNKRELNEEDTEEATTADNNSNNNNHNINNNDDKMTTPNLKKLSSSSSSSMTSSPYFKLILLILMVVQNSSTVLVGRHTRANVKSTDDLYVVNHLILVTEAMKLFMSCILEHNATSGKLLPSIHENIIQRPYDFLKVLIPSLLYLLQNSLLYIALSNLSAPLFQVTYQCKLLTTALVSVVMLQRRYSPKQWVCLTTLGVGVAIVVLGEKKSKDTDSSTATTTTEEEEGDNNTNTVEEEEKPPTQSLLIGLISVTVACLSSALAGVYFEKMLKVGDKQEDKDGQVIRRPPVSLWMRNIQLAFFSVVIALAQALGSSTTASSDGSKPFLHGFTFWVWVLVFLQAGGGLLVAAIIKYADNVLKGLATGVSVVVATACSMVLFHTPLTGQFTFGASIILTSVYLFSNDCPGCASRTRMLEKKLEMHLPK